MIDWNALGELYSASQSANEKVRHAALHAIESNLDAWVAEYLSLPANCYQETKTVGIYKFATTLADHVYLNVSSTKLTGN